jgi:hypothetical protein
VMMTMSCICSFGNKNEPAAIYPSSGTLPDAERESY